MMHAAVRLPPRCTFDQDAWPKLARCWHPIARSEDVDEQPYKAMLLDEAVYHSEHLRLGIRDDVAVPEAAAPAG